MTRIELFHFTGPKDRQEDSFFILPPLPGILSAIGVFDGVGSTRDGHYAALHAAVRAQTGILRHPRGTAPSLLTRALEEANHAVITLRKRSTYSSLAEDQRPAAVGIIALLDTAFTLHIGHAGDAGAILIHEDRTPLTNAHTAEDGSVTRYFGQEPFTPDINVGKLRAHEAFWLMTDGARDAYLSNCIHDPAALFGSALATAFTDNATAIRLARGVEHANH